MRQALDAALADPATRTRDIAGRADLAGMTDAILKALAGNQGKQAHAQP
jgi:isocitrate/isopropylmalate dehydrogenase